MKNKLEERLFRLNSGEGRIEKIGGVKMLVSRDVFLDKMGNSVYRASEISSGGSIGKQYRTTNDPMLAVNKILELKRKVKK